MKLWTLESLQEQHGKDRLHFCGKDRFTPRKRKPSKEVLARREQDVFPKPYGLWYSGGNDWARWCCGERFNLERIAHVHRLHLNESRVLSLDTTQKMIKFAEKYEVQSPMAEHSDLFLRAHNNMVDWAKVGEEYGGIEIIPYQWEMRMDWRMWYYGWDCASGCIWDIDVIESVEYLGAFDTTVKEEVYE